MTTEAHLAHELRLLRGSVEETNTLIKIQVLPAIDGLDNRVGALEIRVEDLENSQPTQPRPIAAERQEPPAPWLLAFAVFALSLLALAGGGYFLLQLRS